jgi:uncharacterized membrane protein YhhN
VAGRELAAGLASAARTARIAGRSLPFESALHAARGQSLSGVAHGCADTRGSLQIPGSRRRASGACAREAGAAVMTTSAAAVPASVPSPAWRRALPLAGALCAALAIASAPWALGQPWLNFAFKPLATLCVIAWAASAVADDVVVKRWIVAGLACSLAGDVALLWPVQGFLAGLVSFLLGHLAYLVALTRRVRLAAVPMAFVAWAAVAGGVLSFLWHGVPQALRVPVIVYVAALSAMAAQASTVWRMRVPAPDAARWGLVALGGALFVASDAVLAIDKFVGGVPMPTLWNLSTYWLAQWLIARAAQRA